jgi:hypothetical protein
VLADFPVAVSLNGERYVVVCRDVSTASFFYQYPELEDAKTEAGKRAEFLNTQTWMFHLLTRVTVDPVLSIDLVQRLDDGAIEAVVAYCHAVGWFTDADLARQAAVEGPIGAAARYYQQSLGALADEVLPTAVTPPRLFRDQHLPYVHEIAPSVRAKVRAIADRTHTRPSTIWLSPISETMIDYRILIDGDETAPARELTGEDAQIGFVN